MLRLARSSIVVLLATLLSGCAPSAEELYQADQKMQRFADAPHATEVEAARADLIQYASTHRQAMRNALHIRALDVTEDVEWTDRVKARAGVYALGQTGDTEFLGWLVAPDVDPAVLYALADSKDLRFYYAFTEGAGYDQIVPPDQVATILIESPAFEPWRYRIAAWKAHAASTP
jgi:hypothetical protein